MAYTKRGLALSVFASTGVLLVVTVADGMFTYYLIQEATLRSLTFVSAARLFEESLKNTKPFQTPDSKESSVNGIGWWSRPSRE